jgi:hypothetical protein
MLLSTLLQQYRVKITPPIQALIDKFENPEISHHEKKYFVERIKSLCGYSTNLFGVHDTGDFTYYPYKYATLEFAIRFPKFEMLFVEIWILMNPVKVRPSYDRNDMVEYYYYQHRSSSVEITINDDSVKIVIPNRDFDINRLEMTINVDSVNLVISEAFYTPEDLEQQRAFEQQEQERKDSLKKAHDSSPQTCGGVDKCEHCKDDAQWHQITCGYGT